MSNKFFIDTNIIVYAHDRDAGLKHERAREFLSAAWQKSASPVISTQVLQELFVSLVRKGVSASEGEQIIRDYSAWQVVENSSNLILAAIKELRRWKVSFWDALILAATRSAQIKEIYSEDFNTGQNFDGIRIINPLLD